MKSSIIYKTIAVICAGILIVGATYLMKENSPNIETSSIIINEKIEKNSDLNNVKVSLISTSYKPYKNVIIEGNNLIDGSYANRTVFAFTITGIKDINKYFKDIKLFEGEKQISLNKKAYQYNKDEVLVICAADNKKDIANCTISLIIQDPTTNEEKTFSRELSKEKVVLEDFVNAGDLLKINDSAYWYRSENGEEINRISKNGNKGPFYEYSRTLNFTSFGDSSNIDVSNIKIESNIKYPYDTEIKIFEKNGEEIILSENKDITGEKQIKITFKVYTNEMNDSINQDIMREIDMSYFILGQKVPLTDKISK